jgi:hypothetical protein
MIMEGQNTEFALPCHPDDLRLKCLILASVRPSRVTRLFNQSHFRLCHNAVRPVPETFYKFLCQESDCAESEMDVDIRTLKCCK